MDLSQFHADRSQSDSVFHQLAIFIKNNVDSGTLMPGDRLPTERSVSEQTGLARGTVRNAFHQLEQEGLIRSKRGSGSYVAEISKLGAHSPRMEAMRIIQDAIESMRALDMTEEEIDTLFDYCLASRQSDRRVMLAVVAQSPESLLDMKRQLSYLENVSVSVFILESITTAPDSNQILDAYDLIIAPEISYQTLIHLAPESKDKIIEAVLSPSVETMQQIFSLDRDTRIGIICRTNVFLSNVKNTLYTYGFKEENIQSFFEMDYTTETYFPGGIHALISFHDAHIFTNESFRHRNAELIGKGGKLIRYITNLQKGTLIYIEDRVHAIIQANNQQPAD